MLRNQTNLPIMIFGKTTLNNDTAKVGKVP